MGVGIPGSEKGARLRGMNVDLNLVPFIDLLSVCITFLLLTAVWTQVEALQVDQGTSDGRADETAEPPLTVHLRSDGIWVGRDSATGTTLAMRAGHYDWAGLLAALEADRALHPDAADALIVTDDGVEYQHMIRALDRLGVVGYERPLVWGTAP